MNIEERIQGSKGPDEPLTPHGVQEIETLREGLLITPVSLYVSPAVRTKETAVILNERFHVPIVIRNELVERDFGSLSGELKSTIDQQLLADDLEGHYDYRPYGGESVDEVRLRVSGFLSTLPLSSNETVFVITHRGVIRVLYDLYPNHVSPAIILTGSKHVFTVTESPRHENKPAGKAGYSTKNYCDNAEAV